MNGAHTRRKVEDRKSKGSFDPIGFELPLPHPISIFAALVHFDVDDQQKVNDAVGDVGPCRESSHESRDVAILFLLDVQRDGSVHGICDRCYHQEDGKDDPAVICFTHIRTWMILKDRIERFRLMRLRSFPRFSLARL